eukprot:TRINITY_DN2584_c0_g1_i1.p1 TRINITY_DN2584_c0_g1~~TRINITY_DN2584_c0_g1_i1.p1  ORF type:complete len:201 (-),score=46.05 TRINITY_DN2584_c0_g1_i1:6-608(-)
MGTNPIAFAAPSTDPNSPFELDMATSTVPVGKIEVRQMQKANVPLGWGVDKDGQPSTDPNEILGGGGLTPLGGLEENAGYKGYGLALAVEVLCGVLGGGNFGLKIPPWRLGRKCANNAQTFVAVNPKFFAEDFNQRMFELTEQMHSLPSVDPKLPVLVPGEPERATKKEYEENGVQLHTNLVESLRKLATSLQVEFFSIK